MVNLTSKKPNISQDLTTVLSPGEHDCITQESIVYYSDARFVQTNLVEKSIEIGIGVLKNRCSQQMLLKIQSDLLKSDFTPPDIKEYFRARTNP